MKTGFEHLVQQETISTISTLHEEESMNGHEVMHVQLINARNDENVLFSELISTAKQNFFSDYEEVKFLHCVLLRHFA